MIVLVDRALAFNPRYARGWHNSGFLRLWAGQTDLAIEHPGNALRLSPRAQASRSSWLIGAALFFSPRLHEAVPRLQVAIEDMPGFQTPYRFLAACYGHMELLDKARATIAQLRAITPEVRMNYPLPYRDPRHRELNFSGVRPAERIIRLRDHCEPLRMFTMAASTSDLPFASHRSQCRRI
jgi:tetratricopeptide (TPR) repeat protein